MNGVSRIRKNVVRGVVAVMILADVALLAWNLRPSPEALARRMQEQQLQFLSDRLARDVTHAAQVRVSLPEVQRQCDEFYTHELSEVATGYSGVVSDLGAVAKKAGLRTGSISFTQKAVGGRGIMEVEVSMTVDGSYLSVVNFVNGLERSANFYVLESLSLGSSTGGLLKLNLKLRTYFRS